MAQHARDRTTDDGDGGGADDGATGPATGGGALGPALAGAITDYNEALARLAAAEGALADAQRNLDGARARLAGLAAGARVTGARALVPVAGSDDDVDRDAGMA